MGHREGGPPRLTRPPLRRVIADHWYTPRNQNLPLPGLEFQSSNGFPSGRGAGDLQPVITTWDLPTLLLLGVHPVALRHRSLHWRGQSKSHNVSGGQHVEGDVSERNLKTL